MGYQKVINTQELTRLEGKSFYFQATASITGSTNPKQYLITNVPTDETVVLSEVIAMPTFTAARVEIFEHVILSGSYSSSLTDFVSGAFVSASFTSSVASGSLVNCFSNNRNTTTQTVVVRENPTIKDYNTLLYQTYVTTRSLMVENNVNLILKPATNYLVKTTVPTLDNDVWTLGLKWFELDTNSRP